MEILENITYVEYPGQSLQLDLHLPQAPAEPAPIILFVPGGGWRNCSKAVSLPWLQEAGFAVASINYRVSSEATAPANLHDCLVAVRWLRTHAREYGLDERRIGAWGPSAGGHLVALMAGWPQEAGQVSTALQAVCDFCGPTDLTRIAIPEVRARFSKLYEVTELYLGGPVEEHLELARTMSPLTYVSKDLPPFLIAHCVQDAVVPVEESQIYYEALKEAGADVSLHLVDSDSHGVPFGPMEGEVLAFFQRTLRRPLH